MLAQRCLEVGNETFMEGQRGDQEGRRPKIRVIEVCAVAHNAQ